LGYEELLLRDPYSLSHWLNYLEYKGADATPQQRWIIYERAAKVIPGSYKLWMKYIKERVVRRHACQFQKLLGLRTESLSDAVDGWSSCFFQSATRSLCVDDPAFEEVNNLFERCLVHMHKMPLIWVTYLEFLIPQFKLTRVRRTFDRALAALPVTQHEKFIWSRYLAWAIACGVPETGVRVYRRFLKVKPEDREDYAKFLKKSGRIEEAATELAQMVSDENFVSQRGRSKHDIWTELLRLLTRNPTRISRCPQINVDAIIRSGISRFAAEVGKLWTALAEYYIRLGQFEKARDIYEESVNSVATVRDFSVVFDAYAKFEESLLNAKMKEVEEAGTEDTEQKSDQGEDEEQYRAQDENDEFVLALYSSNGIVSASTHPEIAELDIDLSMARLDNLLNRRPLLLSSVILRQNPHHVQEWMNRVNLFAGDPIRQIQTYSEAVSTIDPFQANHGKIERIWVSFARFYESHDDLPNAREVFSKAAKVNFKTVDSLINVVSEWVEMELRHGNYQMARETIKKNLTVPKGITRTQLGWSGEADPTGIEKDQRVAQSRNWTSQQKLYKSTKLWGLYADLEENFGSLETTKAVYDQMLYLKIITPAILLNYAKLMHENKFFEESFRICEKGIATFEYPHGFPIWIMYLHTFMERYGGKKLERIRDLFEQAIKTMPQEAPETKKLFLLYAKYEEEHGLARRAMEIYQRACAAAPPGDRFELYIVYIARCALRFGVAKTREIYEAAMKNLPDAHVKAMCLKYASLEKKLGEIDRARGIYAYGSQFCDPRTETNYWQTWADFEVTHGNHETFKEMHRIRRTVMAKFAAVRENRTATN
jgi:pre-mRNA-splicing factor SYF1